MHIVTTLSDLQAKIDECNAALNGQSDEAMRKLFREFRMDLSGELPPDPFSPEYAAYQNGLYETISGKTYALTNERTVIDPAAYERRPFPYYLNNAPTAGHHLLAIGFLLCQLELPPKARVVEFGPGWGNTTIELARLGMNVTAVDIEPAFCELIRRRAALSAVDIDVVEADFFWAEDVTEPFDAAIFFECFHHCSDHMRLLRALRRTVKPEGRVYLGSEPIFPAYPVPWGVRMDGEALWAMRNFGWLELGFDEAYFREALARTGWIGTRHICSDVYWASVWELRPSDESVCLPAGVYPPIHGKSASWDGSSSPKDEATDADLGDAREIGRLKRELAAVHASTSWRLTQPVRALSRAARRLRATTDRT